MPEPNIIVQSRQSPDYQLPGVVVLPDAKTAIRMGSGAITSLISSGGMAIIYEIWNPELEVKRAIKLLHPDHTKESEDRFQTEIKITAKLHHPNIVEIYAVGKWNELPYIEMERIDGLTLEKLIAETGGLPVEVCTSVGIMTGRALNYAHNQDYQIYGKQYHGIIHRDLKPGNIMVTNAGIVKLMDFGIAKPMTASTRTMEGVVMGTMQYLAPEQLDGKDVDVRADIYSLGTVLYEMLAGSRAFPEQNLGTLVTDKLNNNYIPLDGFSRKIPPALCGLVHKCLRYEKEKRIQNALEFLKALGHVHKSLSERSPEQILLQYMKEAHHGKTIISIRKNSRPMALKWLAGAVFVAALIAAGWRAFPLLNRHVPQKPMAANAVEKPLPQPQGNEIKDVFDPKVKSRKTAPAPSVKSATHRASAAAEAGKKKRERPAAINKPLPPAAKPVDTQPHAASVSESKQAVAPLAEPIKKTVSLDKLKQQYKTSDLMVIFSGEVEAGRFHEALAISEKIDKSDADKKKVKIYKLRALKAIGEKTEETRLLLSGDIFDGEYYLEKALYFFEQRDLSKTQELLKKASVSPCGFLDPKAFRQNLLYSIALCASAIYDQQGGDETRKKAMEAWYDVKSLFRTSPEHGYFKKADSEIRRISKTN
jgi:serine/threonine-protein kinase